MALCKTVNKHPTQIKNLHEKTLSRGGFFIIVRDSFLNFISTDVAKSWGAPRNISSPFQDNGMRAPRSRTPLHGHREAARWSREFQVFY